MKKRAFFKWVIQTPWLALVGAVGLILLVVGLAQSGPDFIMLPGSQLQIVGAIMFVLFLLLTSFYHQQDLDQRLATLEAHSNDFRAARVADLDERIEALIQGVNKAINDDSEAK
jgi:hypothetical protein